VGFLLLVLAVPAVAAAALVLLPRWRATWHAAVVAVPFGVLLAAACVGAVYLSAPTDARGPCSDCGSYGGHYWEPALVVFIAGLGLVAWLFATAFAVVARAFRTRRGSSPPRGRRPRRRPA
jgi:hypothetical protein